jgi:hypothetical protein
VPRHLLGRHCKEAQLALPDTDGESLVLVGLDRSPPERPNTRFVLNPLASECAWSREDLVLRPGDNLIVLAYGRPSLTAIDQEDLWSGRVLNRT